MYLVRGLKKFAAMMDERGPLMSRRPLGQNKRRDGLGKGFAQLIDLLAGIGQFRGDAQVILEESIVLRGSAHSPKSTGSRQCLAEVDWNSLPWNRWKQKF